MNEEDLLGDDPELTDGADPTEEMYEHYSVTVDKGQNLLRIDKFLTNRMEGASRNRIQTAADAGNILVNGVPVKSSYKVKPLDRVSIVMPYPLREVEIIPENIPLDIRYEDDDLIIVNKPAAMVAASRSRELFGNAGQRVDLSSEGSAAVPRRRYAGRFGAPNRQEYVRYPRSCQERTVACAPGQTVFRSFDPSGLSCAGVGQYGGRRGHGRRKYRPQRARRLKMAVFPDGDGGKHAVTHYRVLERLGYVNLIECRLETGRTHQIRVHMEYIGHPLFNDERYGGDRILKGTTFSKYKQFVENCFRTMPRHGLHARSLGFIHPATGKEVFFESEMPDDMRTVLDRWRNYVSARPEEGVVDGGERGETKRADFLNPPFPFLFRDDHRYLDVGRNRRLRI